MPEPWSDRRSAPRRGSDPLEQRLDRLVSAGRQLVDGVSGARPGSRSSGRPGLPRLDGLGLSKHLSSNRTQGLASLIGRIDALAMEAA